MIRAHLCRIQGNSAIYGCLDPFGSGWHCSNCGRVFASLEDAPGDGPRTIGATS